MTIDEFRQWHQEFRSASDDLIGLHLASATLKVAPDVYGEFTEDAIRLKAAHSLAMTPFGQSARLVAEDGSTIYEKQLATIRRSTAQNMLVI